MVKIYGVILVITASTIAGFSLARRYSDRCKLLHTWIAILEFFQTEIYHQARLLPAIFQETAGMVGNPQIAESLKGLAKMTEFGADQDLETAWGHALTTADCDGLTKEDLQILKEVGSYLGSSGRDDQVRKLRASKARLEINLQAAVMESKKWCSLYRYLGFAAGAVLVLWLL